MTCLQIFPYYFNAPTGDPPPVTPPTPGDFIIENTVGRAWPVRLDNRISLEGSYNAGTNTTTWTVPYETEANSVEVILGPNFTKKGRVLNVSYPEQYKVAAVGDFSASEVIIGIPYNMCIVLSKIYLREGDKGEAITGGRLTLRRLFLDYIDSGFFTVEVTPQFRETTIAKFTGRIIGKGSNLVGENPIESGVFSAKIGSKADTVTIKICSDKQLPVTITSGHWLGTFNEISRQDG
jgi:hypothetical protein